MAAHLRITIAGRELLARVERGTVTFDGVDGAWTIVTRPDGRSLITRGNHRLVASSVRTPEGVWVGATGVALEARVESARTRPRGATSEADALRPPMSATVVRVHVATGAQVSEGDVLIVLEAMKMELPIRAPRAGVVGALHCREGELVQPSTVLIDLEPV